MIKFDGILVVEGNTDEALIRTFIDCEVVKTGGSAVTRETINYLKECSKYRKIIVLTDPDFPGKQIRNKLNNEIPNLCHAFVPKELSIKHGKVGVAESSKDVIIDALNHLLINTNSRKGNLSSCDLLELGIIGCENSSEIRKKLEKELRVGNANGKTILKRLNSLNITKEKLRKILYGC